MTKEQIIKLEMIAEAGPYKFPVLQSYANMLVSHGINTDKAIEIVRISANSCTGYYTTNLLPEVIGEIKNLIKGEDSHGR